MTRLESISDPIFHLASYDVRRLLPDNWQQDILSVARRGATVDAEPIRLSHAVPDGRPLRYRVSTGSEVRRAIPWLWELYSREFLRLATAFAGEPIDLAADEQSAINLNLLSGAADSYEWHVDTNPVTGLLFVTDHVTPSGGELRFHSETLGVSASIKPFAGTLLLFDATQMPHAVEPIPEGAERVSVPMNYYRSSSPQARPDDLNRHIYSSDGS